MLYVKRMDRLGLLKTDCAFMDSAASEPIASLVRLFSR